VKMISTHPYPLAVRPANRGWEILCAPGPLAQLLSQLAPVAQPETVSVEGQTMLIIPLTTALDGALERLVNTLINLRYDAGRVQLELFSEEEL
jgi:hypothetical protein